MGPVKQKMKEVVRRIPRGCVSWFGAIAAVATDELDRRVTAQVIGWQLSALPEHEWNSLPRRRVVAKDGYVSSLKLGDKGWRQIQLLEKEGITVEHNSVDMDIYAVGPEQLAETANEQ